ncbi:MAG: hypothetical protein CL946_00685, partial [Ectothiorhodospiraceae bacterium]|nr:hypothetical protein [Ectothiorhodospiraceae bacterium]
MSGVFLPDTAVACPSHTIVTASAGSGKTYTLTWRFVQYLLSLRIPGSDLRNLLAITFTNNAALEMKSRILANLKGVALKEPAALAQAQHLVDADPDALAERARACIDEILEHYSDFQVETIDSFMTRVFRASAIDLNLPAESAVELDPDDLFQDAFRAFTAEAAEGSDTAALLSQIVDSLLLLRTDNQTYLWQPVAHLRDAVKNLYVQIMALDAGIISRVTPEEVPPLEAAFRDAVQSLYDAAQNSGCELQANFQKYCDKALQYGPDAVLSRVSYTKPIKKGSAGKAK